MADLTIPATASLLDDWCGPALDGGNVLVMVSGPVYEDEDGDPVVDAVAADEGCVVHPVPLGDLRLDLARAEVRGRVCRALAGALLRDVPPNGDGYSWRSDVFRTWMLRSHNLNWHAGFAPDTSNWCGADEGNRTGRFPSRSVPGLGELDPDDGTRLPDGCRRVDAEALRLAWLEVSHG